MVKMLWTGWDDASEEWRRSGLSIYILESHIRLTKPMSQRASVLQICISVHLRSFVGTVGVDPGKCTRNQSRFIANPMHESLLLHLEISVACFKILVIRFRIDNMGCGTDLSKGIPLIYDSIVDAVVFSIRTPGPETPQQCDNAR
jgi:hypothetical protein